MTEVELTRVIDRCEAEMAAAKRAFLTVNGWVEGCDSPGSFWLWRRSWRGKDYTAGTDFAVRMQTSICMLESPLEDSVEGDC